MKKVTVMVPTFNEEENVVPLSEAIIQQFEQLGRYDYEILFIDNDSRDGTRARIRELCAGNRRIKAIFNARNFGQFNSPYYGITQSQGDCVISMCADFQDPPEMIPKYLEEWENGYKIVMGQKTSSKENPLVYAARSFYYRFMQKHSDTEWLKQVTGSGLYDREFVDVMRDLDDPRPFLRGVVAELGWDVKLIKYEQPKRRAGRSSNNFARYYDAAVQSLTAYTKTGIRLIMAVGLIFSLVSVATAIGCLIYKFMNWDTFGSLELVLLLAIFIGISFTMVFLGIIGEYILNINGYMKRRPLVVEKERINFDE